MEFDFEVTVKVRVKDIGCPYLKLWNPKNSSLCVYFAGLLLGLVEKTKAILNVCRQTRVVYECMFMVMIS